jgi:hypothetical protein
MDKHEDSIVIFSGTLWEAQMVQSLLQNAEIECYIMNSIFSTYAINPVEFEETKIMISSCDYDKAKEVVEQYYKKNNTPK